MQERGIKELGRQQEVEEMGRGGMRGTHNWGNDAVIMFGMRRWLRGYC